jgi:hypothetical protein
LDAEVTRSELRSGQLVDHAAIIECQIANALNERFRRARGS